MARGDETLGDKNEVPGEELVDVDGGVELGELGEEFRSEIKGIIRRLLEPGANDGALG